ncbi:MAG: hypothetical protein HKN47_01720 [Pirellulaceae bacterium]|nr:hypothetical protein [Pirellulaceae bacterium]
MASENDMTGTIVTSSEAKANGLPAIVSPVPIRPEPAHSPNGPIDVADATSNQNGRQFRDTQIVSCLISTILHTIALLVLALFTYGAAKIGPHVLSLQGQQTDSAPVVTLEQTLTEDDTHNHLSASSIEPVNVTVLKTEAVSVQSPLRSETIATTMDQSIVGQLAVGATHHSDSKLVRLPGGGLSGRTPQGRTELGERFGATPQSEAAVDRALRWLALHQRPDGSWSFNLNLDPCNGQCRHSKVSEDTPTPSTGATGLALLAFLGAGHTHQSGPYADTVRRGIYYLRSIAGETENGLDWQRGSMYGHGIALMALGEALTMTRTADGKYETDLQQLVDRGAFFTVVAQHPNGSWGYVPGSPGDTTLTGWQVLSLIAARRNGIELRSYTLPRAKEFLMSVKSEDEWSFGYKGPPGEPTMNAIALTLLLYLGQTPGYTPFDRALDQIAERGPALTNVYHDYYATLALHHARHRDWDRWNDRLRDHLVATQSQQGHESGSWHFKDKWGDVGGRLYTTAMCTMMLEVYYRYLPLYDNQTSDFPL